MTFPHPTLITPPRQGVYINMLSWANVSLIADGRSVSDIKQGVTLEVMGEGSSMGPLNDRMKHEMVEHQGDIKYDVAWTTLGEYLNYLVRRGVSTNVASFIGSAELRLAQDLLRHQIPDGDPAAIIDRALTALLEDLAKKKLAAADRPRESCGASPGSRHIPAEVKRAVWLRDGGRCAFVGRNGRRCTDQGFLEFHHVTPYATGGPPTVDNIELRCRAHNKYEAELNFGPHRRSVVREQRAPYLIPDQATASSVRTALTPLQLGRDLPEQLLRAKQ